MEIIDKWLLIYFTVLSVSSSFIPLLLKVIWPLILRRSVEESQCLAEMKELKTSQKELSPIHDFAAHSRLQRKINIIEDRFKQISKDRLNRKAAMKWIVAYGLQGLSGVAMLICAFLYRRVPIVVLDGDLSPFTSILSYPTGVQNAVSPHAWALMTNTAMRTVVKWF